ncbi:MAG: pyrroline-5-carboxylate reductase [Luteolibacter sp.]
MKLGIIGCGKMGTALVSGAIAAGVVKAGDVIGTSVSEGSMKAFAKKTGGEVTGDLADLLMRSDVILLCTKPQDISKALSGFSKMKEGKLMISVAAGVPLSVLEKGTPKAIRVVRTMPNTPALIGKGAAGYCLGSRCVAGDGEIVEALLGAVGIASKVPEKLMDAVTGVSGSGPAYIYMVIEALADGGVAAGLPRADAIRLAAQTVSGAAGMVLETGLHPAVLKDMVTSPGGTTIAGLAVLEENGVRSAFIEAVSAAAARAKELGS